MKYLLTKLSTRKCGGCSNASFHTAHLTWLGRLRYTGSLRKPDVSGSDRG